jgi:hypothetical protein
VLEPGGHCFILVPNFRSLAVRLLGAKYRYILPQHINYFTRRTLAKLVGNEPRLRIVCARSSHFNPLVIARDWKARGKPASDEERATLLKRTTAYKQSVALKPAKLALGAAEALLGEFYLADNIVVVVKRAGT